MSSATHGYFRISWRATSWHWALLSFGPNFTTSRVTRVLEISHLASESRERFSMQVSVSCLQWSGIIIFWDVDATEDERDWRSDWAGDNGDCGENGEKEERSRVLPIGVWGSGAWLVSALPCINIIYMLRLSTMYKMNCMRLHVEVEFQIHKCKPSTQTFQHTEGPFTRRIIFLTKPTGGTISLMSFSVRFATSSPSMKFSTKATQTLLLSKVLKKVRGWVHLRMIAMIWALVVTKQCTCIEEWSSWSRYR